MMTKLRAALKEHRGIAIVMALLLLMRLLTMLELGFDYSLNSDDAAYINSGVYWAKTGTITIHDQYPSAQIMPGMTVGIGLLSLVFGQGDLLWLVLKLLWMCMGTLTALYLYRTVCLFAPKWCGIAAALPLFRADFLWTDNIVLTETPFLLCLSAMVYYTFQMGKKQDWKSFWLCLLSWMGGLMLKANIGLYPLFALVYLLCCKYDIKRLVKQCLVLGAVALCFLVPWTVRNYIHFDAFIPLTYGAGNPTLLGTYQGQNYPADADLDYETHVDAVMREEYARYYGEDGQPLPQFARYLRLESDGVKARYRQRVWWETDPMSMLGSYLLAKPRSMINSVFYWMETMGTPKAWLTNVQRMDVWLCLFSLAAAFTLKKYRKEMVFLLGVYVVNIYIYAMTFSFDRYNAPLMGLRFVTIGLGLDLFIRLLKQWLDRAGRDLAAEAAAPAVELPPAEVPAEEEKAE